MSDYYNIIDSAEKRAREEGLLQGRLEGREEGRVTAILQNAKKMKELGIDTKTIILVTGLNLDAISNL